MKKYKIEVMKVVGYPSTTGLGGLVVPAAMELTLRCGAKIYEFDTEMSLAVLANEVANFYPKPEKSRN